MDDFLILLQAKLDEVKSKGNINADISKIQNQLDKLKLQAEIDPKTVSDLVRQLEGILNQKITISNIGIDQSQSVRAAQKTGQQIGEAISQGITNTVKKTNNTLKSFTDLKSFSELNKSINNFHVDTSELKNYKSILDEVKNIYSEFGQVRISNEIFKDGVLEKFKVNIEQVNGDLKETKSFIMALNDGKDAFVFSGLISGSESVVQHLDKTKNAVNQTAEVINTLKEKAQIDKIQLSIGDKGDVTTQVKTLSDNFTKLGLSADEVKSKMNGVDTELAELKSLLNSGASNSEIITQFDKMRSVLKETQNDLKTTRSEYSLLVSTQQRLSKANEIEAWNQKNSKATKEVISSNEAYISSLRDLNSQMTKMQFNDIVNGFKQSEISMRGLNKLGASLKDQFSQAAQSFTQWLSVSSGVMTLVYQLQKMPKEVIKVDSAMVELNKVSDASVSEISKYFDEAANSAKKYGSAVSDMINATADWSRLGYNLPDSKKLAEIATLYTNVGDGIDMSTANEHLISTLQGFKMTADEAIHVIDSFNEVANTEAINTAGIGEALQRSASSMYAAGNTLEETIGLVTAANAVVQDPDSIGNAYKTISMRIRGAKTEMEDLGLETDGMVESTAKLQEEILALSGVDIMKDKNTFKSTYQILDELATKWQDLTDIQQASITELIAGKRQGNIVSALMSNFETARRATETAVNSTGSALKEQEKYEQGIEYSLKRLEAVFQSFSNHTLDSGFVKGIVDFGSNTVEVIDKITSKLGSLGTIGLGAGLFAGAKNTGKCRISVRISNTVFCFEYALHA